MSDTYRRAVHSKLPRTHIVADRFHVIKQLNHRIDLIRRSIQRKAKQDDDEALYQTLKGNRWLLLRNRNTLTPEQEAVLGSILDTSNELRIVYLLKEEFRAICDKIPNRQRAEPFLRVWRHKARATGIRCLIDFVDTFRLSVASSTALSASATSTISVYRSWLNMEVVDASFPTFSR